MSSTTLRASCCASAAALLLSVVAARASVEISSAATKNMNCAAGVCSPTAKKAVLNVTDLTNMLASGDVKITTGAGAITITVESPFSWTSTHRLTLDAYQTVSFRAPVAVAGAGAVTITYNDGGTGGDLIFFPGTKLDFWDTGSKLKVNGTSFILAGNIKQVASLAKQDPSGAYALANDDDASADGPYRHSPVSTIFAGIFEGLGHSIENLAITGGPTSALFVGAQPSAIMRDIKIENATIVATGKFVRAGILIGESHGTVQNASASGSVQGMSSGGRGVSFVGGLVGANIGRVANSSAAATVSAANKTAVGGLVGYSAPDALIVASHATGTVTGGNNAFVGGLAGQAYAVEESYATGGVKAGAHSDAGGLAGLGDSISRSFANGAVTGEAGSRVGGLVGDGASISGSYATGAVQGGDHARVGGLMGEGYRARRSYATGAVTGGSRSRVGGFVGDDDDPGTLSDTYWDLDTSGVSDPSQGAGNIRNDPGITGLTDAQLKSQLPEGFDPAIWGQSASINNGYPYLIANPPPQ